MTSYRAVALTQSTTKVAAALHAEVGFEERWDVNAFSQLLAMPGAGGHIALAPDSGDPLGLVLWRIAADEGEILTIGVLPDFRRSGVAQFLLETAASAMRQNGVTRLFLEVAVNNHAAIPLYRRFGFRQEGQRPGYYRSSAGAIDAAIFVKDLSTDVEDDAKTGNATDWDV